MEHSLKLIESISFSHPKSTDKKNEDTVLPAVITKQAIFLALADGVGGSSGGGIASEIAISTVRTEILNNPNITLEEIFRKASKNIDTEAEKSPVFLNMSTTLIVCKISKNKIEIASVGDSRAYILNDNSAKKLTTDHTKKQELIDSGVFKKSELKGHHSGSILTNSLRAYKPFKLEVNAYKYSCGSIFLVSDGVYQVFDGTRVVGNKGAENLLQVCSNIKKRILSKGPKDDFSLVAVSFKSG
jgi:serine/threonine protein phosphatase PrpC